MVLNTQAFNNLDATSQNEWLDDMNKRQENDLEMKPAKRHQFKWGNDTNGIITKYISRSTKSTIKEKITIDGFDTLPYGYEN